MAAFHATRARSLVGTPFRAQGRDVEHGLDCAGLAIAVFGLPPKLGRTDYRLRGDHRAELTRHLAGPFRRLSRRQARPGDLLMFDVAQDQLHLGVMTDAGLVHADARLRRVVETPGQPEWPMIGVYRLRVRK